MRGSPARNPYARRDANTYAALGIRGTTFSIGYDEVARLLGDIHGDRHLDFGCGSGRSSRFLRALGSIAIGVDHSPTMLELARVNPADCCFYARTEAQLPFPDRSFDGAISLNTFVEFETREIMARVCAEVFRVVTPGGPFIIMATNPQAFGNLYRSFSFRAPQELRSGDPVQVTIYVEGAQLTVVDTFWTEDDFLVALRSAGWTITTVQRPRAANPSAWKTDEARTAPFIVIQANRPQTRNACMR